MENTITAIELGSKKLKLVVGYTLNGKVYSIYTMTKPYGQLTEEGFFDFQRLVESVMSVKEINDADAKFNYSISECVAGLPADGLEIFQSKQRTTIVSELGKITSIDIKNLYSLIKNSSLKSSNVLVDIVPESYQLDGNRVIKTNPIGETSTGLVLNAKVHLSPERIFKNYSKVFENADVDVKRVVCGPLGAVEYLSTLDDLPQNYLMIDIGSDKSSISLVGKGSLYGVKSFNWGGDNLTKAIALKFNLSLEDAEKYKKIYGIDTREMNFRAPICTDTTGERGTIRYYKEDLNDIIYKGLDDFVNLLNDARTALLERQNQELHRLPIVLVGGGSQLKGLVQYLLGKVESTDIRVVAPNVIGARDATFTNCLGMILVASKYMSMNEDARFRANNMTRD
ncbi:MAG: rod shape-determining protein [Bacilli bacterium]|nr:rod shape-determining protein [Bacilli bacterium]